MKAVVVLAMLVGCGGAPFAAADNLHEATVEAGTPEADKDVDRSDASEASTVFETSTDASDASYAPESTTACVTDLSNVGTGDFRVSFTLSTTSTAALVGLVNQRAGCDQASTWWDVNMQNGSIGVGTVFSGQYVAIGLSGPSNDGAPHKVVFARTAGVIWYSIDGIVHDQTPSDPYPVGALPPLVVGADACPGYVELDGTLSELCVTTP